MSQTSLTVGQVFGTGDVPEPGEVGTVAFARQGGAAVVSGSPLHIMEIAVSNAFAVNQWAYNISNVYTVHLTSLIIEAVQQNAMITLQPTDLPPPGLVPGIPLPTTVPGVAIIAAVTTDNPAIFGVAQLGLYGQTGNLSLVGVESLLLAGQPQFVGAAILSAGVQPLGDVNEVFSTDLGAPAPVTCYAAGTRLATPRGDVPIEALRVGDAVRLAGGGEAAVMWLGHRDVDCSRHPRARDVLPVLVAAGAFGRFLPARDLRLSPDHSVHVDGVLIPVRYLLNGTTVRQENTARVTYWHVELARHGVLLAEGLPAESYLDTGNRHAFDGGDVVMAHPSFAAPEAALAVWARDACAPLALGGPAVARVRRRLARRAAALGWRTTAEAELRVTADDPADRAVQSDDGAAYLLLSPAARTVRLHSHSFVPAHEDGGEDWRRLGVAVEITLDGAALAPACFAAGFHPAEPGAAWRWTDGAATLALPLLAKPALLRVAPYAAGARYWLPPDDQMRNSRSALPENMAVCSSAGKSAMISA